MKGDIYRSPRILIIVCEILFCLHRHILEDTFADRILSCSSSCGEESSDTDSLLLYVSELGKLICNESISERPKEMVWGFSYFHIVSGLGNYR